MRHIIGLRSDRDADRRRARSTRDRPPRLPDRDLLDELRLAVRARVPRLRRGREGDQHPLHQRRGRRDPRHVRRATASGAASRSPRAASASRPRCSTPPTSPRSRSARARSPARAATCRARRSPRRSPRRETRAPGTDLISPSNNHDLYSIEDLAELIDELKTVNPDLRVSVKVPVVPNIGTIGLGIAKAGADIITLSGFEGGTGAARQHALRHVGLPSDIGTRLVHRALMEAGIRNRVEIWADGGYRHAHDIVKLICMGANRIGVRHPGDGLARLHDLPRLPARHLPRRDRDPDRDRRAGDRARAEEVHARRRSSAAAENCARFFQRWARRSAALTAELGYERTQDLVGRYDLLEQVAARERARPRRADHAARGVPRPRAGRPPGRRRGAGRGARRGRPRPRAADPHGAEARPRPRSPSSPTRSARGTRRAARVPAPDRRQRPRARRRARRGDRAGADLRRRARGLATTCSPSSTSTAARSPARASAPSTPTGSSSGSRAAPRTASARRCSAAPSRS